MDVQTYVGKISPFYRTSSPIGPQAWLAGPQAWLDGSEGGTYVRTNGKSPHSTGLRSLLGPLPCLPQENQGESRARQGNMQQPNISNPPVPKRQNTAFFWPKIVFYTYIVNFLFKFWGPDAIFMSVCGLVFMKHFLTLQSFLSQG